MNAFTESSTDRTGRTLANGGAGRHLTDDVLSSARQSASSPSYIEPPVLTEVAEPSAKSGRRLPALDPDKLKRLVAAQPTRSALVAVAAGAVAMSFARYALHRRRARLQTPYSY
jgi:hypothetical protein